MSPKLVRWSLLILLILTLLGGGVFVYLQFFQPGREQAGLPTVPVQPKPLTAADLLPTDTFLLLRIPNAPKFIEKFKTATVHTLLSNPEVVESWKKAVTQNGPDGEPEPAWEGWPQLMEVVNGLIGLTDGEAFVALSDLRDDAGQPKANAIAGVRVTRDDAAVAAWLEKVQALDPKLEWKAVPDVLHSYYTAMPRSDKPDELLCAARMDQWIFFGFGPRAFESVLARAAEKERQAGSLAESPLYQNTLTGLKAEPDLFTFINFAPLVPWMSELVKKQRQVTTTANGDGTDATEEATNEPTPPSPSSVNPAEMLKGIQGVALTTTLEGENWLDGLRLLVTPGNPLITAAYRTPLSGVTYRFAGRDALVCVVQNTDFSQLLTQLKEGDPAMAEQVDQFTSLAESFLAAIGLKLEQDLLSNLGPENATVLEWAPGSPLPTVLVAWQHRKQEPFKKMLDLLAKSGAGFGGLVQVESTQVGSDLAYTFSSPLVPMPPVTIFLDTKTLVLAFNGGSPESLANRKGPSLFDSPDYLALRERLGPPEVKNPVQIIYLDLKRIYANLHGSLNTWMPMIPGFDASTLSLPTPDATEPFLGRTLWLSQMEGDAAISSSVTEKVHPVFLFAASLGWLIETGDKVGARKTKPTQDEDDTFEAEVLEMETVEEEGMKLPAQQGEPEAIFDNVPGAPGTTTVPEPAMP